MAQRENHFITLMVAWLCLMTAGAPHGKTNASGPLRRPGLESSGGFLTYTSGTCARMTGKLGSAGTLAGVSTWSFQTAWASPQHGSLRMLALLTWQVRTLRANVPAKKLELWGLLELSLRSHTAPLLLHSTGQSHHELAQIQGRGHRPHLSSGRVPNNLKLPPPPRKAGPSLCGKSGAGTEMHLVTLCGFGAVAGASRESRPAERKQPPLLGFCAL